MPAESLFLEQTGLHEEESSDEAAPQNPRLDPKMDSRAEAATAAESKY